MKKILILLLIVLLAVLAYYVIIPGFQISSIKINGVIGIRDLNDQLDRDIESASKLTKRDFEETLSTLKTASSSLEKERQTYQDMVAYSSPDEIAQATQMIKYPIEFLWTTVGLHATSEGVTMIFKLTNSSTGSNAYDLSLTVNGAYSAISDFVRSLENDDSLGFKIENFKILPTDAMGKTLTATFVIKNLSVDVKGLSAQGSTNPDNANKQENDTNTNNSNTNANTNTNTDQTDNNTNTTNTTH